MTGYHLQVAFLTTRINVPKHSARKSLACTILISWEYLRLKKLSPSFTLVLTFSSPAEIADISTLRITQLRSSDTRHCNFIAVAAHAQIKRLE